MIRLKNVRISNLTGNPIPIPYKARPENLVGKLIFDSRSYRRLFIPTDGEISIKITGYSNMDEDKGLFTITKSKQFSLYFKCDPEHSPNVAVTLSQLKLPFSILVPDEKSAERDKNGQIFFFRKFISIKEG